MILPILFYLLLTVNKLSAQTSSPDAPPVYWKFITEKSMVDFFYRIVESENTKQIYLRVKNDLGKERVISFTVEITGTKKISKEISLNAAAAAILDPDYNDKSRNNMLKIDLPPEFDISSLEVKIKLHQ